MSLTTKNKQQLKARAHKLRPVVLVGNQALTPNVLKEIDRALNDHELIKVRIALKEREERRTLFATIGKEMHAELVGLIGNIGILYRKRIEQS